jgi:hypothetical protein
MKIWTKGIVAALLAGTVILGSLPALAGPGGPGPDRREMREIHRMHEARRHLAEVRMRAARMNRWERARHHWMVTHNPDIYAFRPNYYRPVAWTIIWH